MKYLILSIILLALWVGCSKRNPIANEATATIEFQGDYAVDGCGYWVTIDNVIYKPSNEDIFPESYKTQSPLTKTISYIIGEPNKAFQCGLDTTTREVETLEVLEIE